MQLRAIDADQEAGRQFAQKRMDVCCTRQQRCSKEDEGKRHKKRHADQKQSPVNHRLATTFTGASAIPLHGKGTSFSILTRLPLLCNWVWVPAGMLGERRRPEPVKAAANRSAVLLQLLSIPAGQAQPGGGPVPLVQPLL